MTEALARVLAWMSPHHRGGPSRRPRRCDTSRIVRSYGRVWTSQKSMHERRLWGRRGGQRSSRGS